MGDEDGNEEINSAWHALYLETDTDGPTAIIEGNTVPADIETMNTLAEGLYPAHFQGRASRELEDGTNPDQALITNNGQNVPNTRGGTMNQIFFHHGNVGQERLTTSTPGIYVSRGCPTGPSGPNTIDRFNTFMQPAQNFNGNYYLRSNRARR